MHNSHRLVSFLVFLMFMLSSSFLFAEQSPKERTGVLFSIAPQSGDDGCGTYYDPSVLIDPNGGTAGLPSTELNEANVESITTGPGSIPRKPANSSHQSIDYTPFDVQRVIAGNGEVCKEDISFKLLSYAFKPIIDNSFIVDKLSISTTSSITSSSTSSLSNKLVLTIIFVATNLSVFIGSFAAVYFLTKRTLQTSNEGNFLESGTSWQSFVLPFFVLVPIFDGSYGLGQYILFELTIIGIILANYIWSIFLSVIDVKFAPPKNGIVVSKAFAESHIAKDVCTLNTGITASTSYLIEKKRAVPNSNAFLLRGRAREIRKVQPIKVSLQTENGMILPGHVKGGSHPINIISHQYDRFSNAFNENIKDEKLLQNEITCGKTMYDVPSIKGKVESAFYGLADEIATIVKDDSEDIIKVLNNVDEYNKNFHTEVQKFLFKDKYSFIANENSLTAKLNDINNQRFVLGENIIKSGSTLYKIFTPSTWFKSDTKEEVQELMELQEAQRKELAGLVSKAVSSSFLGATDPRSKNTDENDTPKTPVQLIGTRETEEYLMPEKVLYPPIELFTKEMHYKDLKSEGVIDAKIGEQFSSAGKNAVHDLYYNTSKKAAWSAIQANCAVYFENLDKLSLLNVVNDVRKLNHLMANSPSKRWFSSSGQNNSDKNLLSQSFSGKCVAFTPNDTFTLLGAPQDIASKELNIAPQSRLNGLENTNFTSYAKEFKRDALYHKYNLIILTTLANNVMSQSTEKVSKYQLERNMLAQSRLEGWLSAGSYMQKIAQEQSKLSNFLKVQQPHSQVVKIDVDDEYYLSSMLVNSKNSRKDVYFVNFLPEYSGLGESFEEDDFEPISKLDSGVLSTSGDAPVTSAFADTLVSMTGVDFESIRSMGGLSDGTSLVAQLRSCQTDEICSLTDVHPLNTLTDMGERMINFGIYIPIISSFLSFYNGDTLEAKAMRTGVEGLLTGAFSFLGPLTAIVVGFISTAIEALDYFFELVLTPLAKTILLAGLFLLIILPLYPQVLFFFAGIGFVLLVLEYIIALPIWLLFWIITDESGRSKVSKKSLLSMVVHLLTRPVLLIISFIMAWTLASVLVFAINNTYAAMIVGGTTTLGGITAFFSLILMTISYLVLISMAVLVPFKLISQLPPRVYGWVGLTDAGLSAQIDGAMNKTIMQISVANSVQSYIKGAEAQAKRRPRATDAQLKQQAQANFDVAQKGQK